MSVTVQVLVEAELGQGPKALIKVAEEAGWWVVATSGQGSAGRSLVIRGWRRGQRFVMTYIDGKAAEAWWWTREHQAVVYGFPPPTNDRQRRERAAVVRCPDERVQWVSEKAEPERIGVAELKRRVAVAVEVREM